MHITIIRLPSEKGATLSNWYVDGNLQCVGVEDIVRGTSEAKIHGQTAIPFGTYEVIINKSERFSRLAKKDVFLPLLLEVPGFEGVRIHPGNGPKDTEGCLLPGSRFAASGYEVENSRVAFTALFVKMQAALARHESIKLTIR